MVDTITKHLIFSNTVEFLHSYLTQSTVPPSNRIVHTLNFMSCNMKDAPDAVHHEQLSATSKLRDLFYN